MRRELCAEDGRSFNVVPTDAGMAAIEAAAPSHAAAVRHCHADILTPEQLDTLGDIAEAITTHLAADHNHPESATSIPTRQPHPDHHPCSITNCPVRLPGRRRTEPTPETVNTTPF